jgi:hypothetical protein
MLMPDCIARARKSCLASTVRRILLACFFSIMQLYTIMRYKANTVVPTEHAAFPLRPEGRSPQAAISVDPHPAAS